MIWQRTAPLSGDDISVKKLRQIVRRLPSAQPLTDTYELRHIDDRRNWHGNQKQHLIGWLGEYDSAGAYARKKPSTSGRAFYNHFRCMPGLLWLAEALGEEPATLARAIAAVEAGNSNPSSECATFRKHVPWTRIAGLINGNTESG